MLCVDVNVLVDAFRVGSPHHRRVARWFGTALTGLVDHLHLTGDDVPDAFLAAGAMDAGAALVTSDRGFRRFPRLRIVDPSAGDAGDAGDVEGARH